MTTVNHAETVEAYGAFTARESRTVAEYERATVAVLDALDVADSADTYHRAASDHGTPYAVELCRLNRRHLAELTEQMAVLRDQLHLTADGMRTEPSRAGRLFLTVQEGAFDDITTKAERALLDYLLGPVRPGPHIRSDPDPRPRGALVECHRAEALRHLQVVIARGGGRERHHTGAVRAGVGVLDVQLLGRHLAAAGRRSGRTGTTATISASAGGQHDHRDHDRDERDGDGHDDGESGGRRPAHGTSRGSERDD